MRYQTKLYLVMGVLLAVALVAAALSFWTMERSRTDLERVRIAHENLASHLQLSRHAYALIKTLTEALVTADFGRNEYRDLLRKDIHQDLAAIRKAATAEVDAATGDEKTEETKELLRINMVERQILQVLHEFDSIEELVSENKIRAAQLQLASALQNGIGSNFNRLIELAINEQKRELEATEAASEAFLDRVEWTTIVLAAACVLIALLCAVLLTAQLRRPLAELLTGTEALGRGDLSYRIPRLGKDEFARLGQSFNRMAQEIEGNRSAIERAQAELEDRVRERTDELREANEALTEVDRVRRRFFAEISHELRTPLTIIRGEGEISLRGKAKPVADYRKSLGRIVEQAEHMSRLVDDLLFVARQRSGQARLEMADVDVGGLVHQICEQADVLAKAQNIAITCHQDDGDMTVPGDQGRLRQLFLILIDNAIRYSKPRGTINVEAEVSEAEVVVRIADHGIGIPEHELEQIFERFYRGANASERQIEGTGLGLPVARAIAEAHEGSIGIVSRVDEGTTVSVRLPRARAVGEAA